MYVYYVLIEFRNISKVKDKIKNYNNEWNSFN